jgi:type II secretory pathway component PulF
MHAADSQRYAVSVICVELTAPESVVHIGTSLADGANQLNLFDAHTIALFAVGTKSGSLAQMVEQAATRSAERLKKQLQFIMNIIPPLVLMLLGLLVVGLILTVYMPLLEMPALIKV